MRRFVAGWMVYSLFALASAAEAPVPTAAEQIETLKKEVELLKLQLDLQVQQTALTKQSVLGSPEAAEALAQAELAKLLAESEKAKVEAQITRDFAMYNALAKVDLSKAGVAGSYVGKNDLPASLRSKWEVEGVVSKAIASLCKRADYSTSVSSGAVLIDNTLGALETAAAHKILHGRVTGTTTDLEAAIKDALSGSSPPLTTNAFPGVALAALQGLNLLSQSTRLFRTDTSAQAETVTVDRDRTLLPIFTANKSCKATIPRPGLLYLNGDLRDLDARLTAIVTLRKTLERARATALLLEAQIAEWKKKADPASLAAAQAKTPSQVALLGQIRVADALLVELAAVPASSLAASVYLESLASRSDTRFVSIEADGEARRVLRQSAWSSAKPFAVGAVSVRITVRDNAGKVLFTGTAYEETGRVPIEKEASTSLQSLPETQ